MVLLEEGVQLKTLREKGDIAPPPTYISPRRAYLGIMKDTPSSN